MPVVKRAVEQFSLLVTAIYEAFGGKGAAPRALEAVAAALASQKAELCSFDPVAARFDLLVVHGVDAHIIESAAAHLNPNPGTTLALVREGHRPLTRQDLLERETLRATGLAQLIALIPGCDHILLQVLPGPGNTVLTIGVGRDAAAGPYGEAEHVLMGNLAPHLQRAATLHGKLSRTTEDCVDLRGALDALPIGIALTDSSLRVEFINALGRQIVARRDGLMLSQEHLSTPGGASQAALLRAVSRATQARPDRRPSVLSLPRQDADRQLPALVVPVGHSPSQRKVAAILFTDAEHAVAPPRPILRKLFGLTAAEASLLAELTVGRSVKHAAQKLGISEQTARSQLKGMFLKTGTNRQTDLLRLVATSPAWLAPRINWEAEAGDAAPAEAKAAATGTES